MINLAATALVIRDAPTGLEVLMVRRASRSSFMADAFVYPGGRVDDADRELSSVFMGDEQELAARLNVDAATATAIIAGAARETFEEAGILIARREGEKQLVDSSSFGTKKIAKWRTQIHDGELSFATFLERERLVIDDRFTYFAHWTTPVAEKKRFNTFFFVVKAPEHQNATHDEKETVDSLWCRPKDALKKHRSGAFLMFPPTFRTLERLAAFDSTSDVFATHFEPPHILPFLVPDSDETTFYLPGDPDFPADDPEHKTATPVTDGVTRLVLRDGFWQHLDSEER